MTEVWNVCACVCARMCRIVLATTCMQGMRMRVYACVREDAYACAWAFVDAGPCVYVSVSKTDSTIQTTSPIFFAEFLLEVFILRNGLGAFSQS